MTKLASTKLASLIILFAALLFVAPVQHIVAHKPTVQVVQDPQDSARYEPVSGSGDIGK